VGAGKHGPACSARHPERPGPSACKVGSALLPGVKDLRMCSNCRWNCGRAEELPLELRPCRGTAAGTAAVQRNCRWNCGRAAALAEVLPPPPGGLSQGSGLCVGGVRMTCRVRSRMWRGAPRTHGPGTASAVRLPAPTARESHRPSGCPHPRPGNRIGRQVARTHGPGTASAVRLPAPTARKSHRPSGCPHPRLVQCCGSDGAAATTSTLQ